MKRLAILGASGHGKVVADIAECSGWELIDFFDDDENLLNKVYGSWLIRGNKTLLLSSLTQYDAVVLAIGNNSVRQTLCDEFSLLGIDLATLIHPSSTVSRHAEIGCGTVVMAGAIVNPGTIIGRCAIINTAATVDHDCHLGDYVHVSPGAHLAGGVVVGAKSWIGIGACVKHQITIGSQVTVGAGAAVIEDLADNITVVGVPAQPISF